MTTIAEDLKTTIDTDWADGTVTCTTYVFMKTSTTTLDPPSIPAANNVSVVIFEGIGTPIRYTNGADLIVYEGELICYAPSYATMILANAELKEIADNLTTGTGNLSFSVPTIEGSQGLYHSSIRYKWEKLTSRG